MRSGLKDPHPHMVGIKAWRVFQAVPRQAWATARQIAENLGDPEITSLDVASAARSQLRSYVERREDPGSRSVRWQYQRVPM